MPFVFPKNTPVMKKTLLLFLLAFLLATPFFAQEKTAEFGFSLKGGTYTTYKSGEMKYRYVPTDLISRPGYSAAVGIYGKCRLGRWLALSGEMMYGFAEFSTATVSHFEISLPSQGIKPYSETRRDATRFVARNLFLPVNLYIGRGLGARFSGYVGAAPMFNLETTVSYDFDGYGFDQAPTQPKEWDYYREPGVKDPRWQWLLSAGLEYRLGQHYALGLQMLLNVQPIDTSGEFNYAPQRYPVPMKSVSVTLRHSL